MKAKRILKGHRWFQNSCSCGPVHDPAVRSERKGCLVKVDRVDVGMGVPDQKDKPAPVVHSAFGQGKKAPLWARRMRSLPCHYCGEPGGTIDHVVPRCRGGRTTEQNCVPACAPCNNWRKDADYVWFKEIGWKKRPFAR
jgi:5-methylcytosine-specific restriction endonuclease McrA